jgi:hypothetical protein
LKRNIPKIAAAFLIGALVLPGLLLMSAIPTASAAPAHMGRVTVSGNDILIDGVKPNEPFFGVDDTTVLAYAIDYHINGNKQVAGWSSVFNSPDTGTHVPVTPNDTPDAFWNQYFAQMEYYGVNVVRIGTGDSWGTGIQYNAWMNHRAEYYDMLHTMSYYAQVHGVYLVFVVAGTQEYPTFGYSGTGSVFDPSSSAFANYVTYAKANMAELENENAVAMFDLFNEPDHNGVNAAYWHGDKVKFNTWAKAVASATAGASSHPRTMGVAGFDDLFGMNQADFNLATGNTGFEVLHRHYYGANSDPNNFQAPEQWAKAVNKPLLWGELAYNGAYPLTRYTYGEQAISAAGGQAVISMVLTGTAGYPYTGGVAGKGQVPMPSGGSAQSTPANEPASKPIISFSPKLPSAGDSSGGAGHNGTRAPIRGTVSDGGSAAMMVIGLVGVSFAGLLGYGFVASGRSATAFRRYLRVDGRGEELRRQFQNADGQGVKLIREAVELGGRELSSLRNRLNR